MAMMRIPTGVREVRRRKAFMCGSVRQLLN
jgi:hypothetical protein